MPRSPTAHSTAAGATSHKQAKRTPPPPSQPMANRTRLTSAAKAPSVTIHWPAWPAASGYLLLHPTPPARGMTYSAGSTNLRSASPMDRAVSAVAVATMSAFAPRPQRRTKARANSRPNSSRPAVWAGFCEKTARAGRSSLHFPEPFPKPRSCRRDRKLVEQPLGDGIDHHIARTGIEGDYAFAAKHRPGSLSGWRYLQCSAQSAPRAHPGTEGNQEREPAARLFLRRPCRPDENPKLPARRRAPRCTAPSPVCHVTAARRPRNIARLALVKESLSMTAHQLRFAPGTCAASPEPRPHRVRPTENSAAPSRRPLRADAFIAASTACALLSDKDRRLAE